MIEQFTREEFEKCLPNNVALGLIGNEFCYLIPVTEQAGILIRSSVSSKGYADDVGDDSIRVYPAEIMRLNTGWGYNLQGNTEHRWITRQPGWNNRLQYTLKILSHMIKDAGECEECGKPLKILKVKKEGANKGRWFATCEKEHHQFKWISQD